MSAPLHAFGGVGIELEYMIVDRETLNVLPIADRLLAAAPGSEDYEVTHGEMGWSNELVMHVVEVKNLAPATSLDGLPAAFRREVGQINGLLAGMGARLMPGAMHPWMDPDRETRLWPHQNQEIYAAYDRIFDSRGHGWSNLQSMHVNLPFAGDEEFARLHAAIRLVLPLIPALAASSPFADGRDTGYADYRMHVYTHNADRMPSIAGLVVPETARSQADYEARILQPMYDDIAALDPDHVLRYEWLNSRGAIARFDRDAIEIRVIDTQEHPGADLAVAAAVVDVTRRLYDGGELNAQQEIATEALAAVLTDCIRDGDAAIIDNARYLKLLGFTGARLPAAEVWRALLQPMMASQQGAWWAPPLETILRHGTLARRLRDAFAREGLAHACRRLCDCLEGGHAFLP
ncbi:MAG TPA: glutamate-cysteine ligase family protein [Noviherbaspirillum sp.]